MFCLLIRSERGQGARARQIRGRPDRMHCLPGLGVGGDNIERRNVCGETGDFCLKNWP